MRSPSLSGRIMAYLSGLSPEERRATSSREIAAVLGTSPERASKLLWSLENNGRLTLIRVGWSITGVESVDRVDTANGQRHIRSPRRDQVRERTEHATSTTRLVVPTPRLERYAAAKHKASELAKDEYFNVTFHEDEIAEEALRLRTAFDSLQAEYRNLARLLEVLKAENDGLKARFRERTASVASEIHARDDSLVRDAVS